MTTCTVGNLSFIMLLLLCCQPTAAEPQSTTPSSSARSKKYSHDFEFSDNRSVVIVRGSRWIPLFPKLAGYGGMSPGATVECVIGPGTCVVTQFYDGGATSTDTTYKITRWDSDRIEAENGSVDIPNRLLSEGYRQALAAKCLILNRARKQVFTVEKQEGQTCRQLDKYIDDGVVMVSVRQLCALRVSAPTIYDCPNPPSLTGSMEKPLQQRYR